MTHPLISVIIPSYRSAPEKLERALRSAASQDFDALEIIVVDDNDERSESKILKKAVHAVKKDKALRARKCIRIEGRGENRGLVEARRLGVLCAKGDYVCMLDSDDELLGTDAISRFYERAMERSGGYDIVMCRTEPFKEDSYILEDTPGAYDLLQKPPLEPFVSMGAPGEGAPAPDAPSPDAFCIEYITSKKYSLMLWAKIIRRSVFLDALEHIPMMNCFMAEDLLFSYFISLHAQSYIGLDATLYRYRLGEGISTSADTIDSMERWIKLCTTSSVFTTIFYDIEEHHRDERLKTHMRKTMTHFALRTCKLLERVVPEKKEEALCILKEMWGEELIVQVMKHL